MHTTNVSCFNLGYSSIANNHELKIEPLNQIPQLQQQAEMKKTAFTQGLRTPPANKLKADSYVPKEDIYQETAPSTGHNRQFSRKDFNQDEFKVPPKRLRSLEKEPSTSSYMSS